MNTLKLKVMVVLCLFSTSLTAFSETEEKEVNPQEILKYFSKTESAKDDPWKGHMLDALQETDLQVPALSEAVSETLEMKIQNGYFQLGGNLKALNQAMCFHNKNKEKLFRPNGDPSKTKGISISESKYVMIFDLTKSSRAPRLFLINLETGEVQATTVAHGRGIGQQEIDNKEFARHLSNKGKSFLSSNGWFITGEKYKLNNQNWKYGIHLYGLQKGVNDNVFTREVIMHPDPGVQGPLWSSAFGDSILQIPQNYVQPRSWGCLMLPPAVAADVIERVQMQKGTNQGTLLYSFSEVENKLSANYCGE